MLTVIRPSMAMLCHLGIERTCILMSFHWELWWWVMVCYTKCCLPRGACSFLYCLYAATHSLCTGNLEMWGSTLWMLSSNAVEVWNAFDIIMTSFLLSGSVFHFLGTRSRARFLTIATAFWWGEMGKHTFSLNWWSDICYVIFLLSFNVQTLWILG